VGVLRRSSPGFGPVAEAALCVLRGYYTGHLCPWRIGAITAAALVLLHHEHDRTT
jgi:hypothetical protein